MKMQMNYIAGRWIDGIDVIINVSPSDLSDTVGEYAIASTAQVEEAIAAARASSRAWAQSPIQGRLEILQKVGNEVLARKEEFGRLLSREEGKVLADGIGEVELDCPH